jgi:hypothetical protein
LMKVTFELSAEQSRRDWECPLSHQRINSRRDELARFYVCDLSKGSKQT